MLLTKILCRFRRDETGAVAVVVSLALTMLIGFVALGVDMASLYRERGQLQAAADLTAMSVAGDFAAAQDRATAAIGNNDRPNAALTELELGRFLRNPAIAPADRFVPLAEGTPGINAARVVLRDDAALHFARIFTSDDSVTLTRTALATRTGAASFSLGGHLARLDDAALSRLIEQDYGINVGLSAGDLEVLANETISLGGLLDALQEQSGLNPTNPADILNAVVAGDDLVAALGALLPASVSGRLSGLEAALQGQEIAVSAVVGGMETELGLTVTEALAEVQITARDLIVALLSRGPVDPGAALDMSAEITGVLSAEAQLRAGEPPAQSGWVAIGEEGVELSHAAARLSLDTEIEPALLGGLGVGVEVARINLPVHLEVAGATATLEQVSCTGTLPGDLAARFSVAPTPLHPNNGTSVAALYLGNLPDGAGATDLVNPTELGFADLLDVNIVVALPLLPDVTLSGLTIQARSHVEVGASAQDEIVYTRADVAAGDLVRGFGSKEVLSTAVASLLDPSRTEFRIKPGQEGVVSGVVAPVVADLLAVLPSEVLLALTGPVDGVLDTALAGAGLQVGAGELTLTGYHCELIRLVR